MRKIIAFGRTLKCQTGDILAYFNHLPYLQLPTEAINSHLDYLYSSALGLRNLIHYITQALRDTEIF